MDIRSLDWERLKIFQAVAENGSISAAASQLIVSHAKVSRDIEELEATLGQELFLRSTRGMQLTGIGADVLRSVQNMADAANAIHARVSEADQAFRVVIATHDAMATYWLARRLPEFLRAHPNIEVIVRVVDETPNLLNGDGDIAIQYEAPTAPNIISRQLGWLHYVLYASPTYLSIHGVPETMFDVGHHRFMMLTGYNKQKELWDPKTPHWIEVFSRAFQSNSSTVILECCACDGGIAPMPTYVSEFEPRVQPLTHIRPLASARFWLAFTERVKGLPQFEPVLAWLRESYDPNIHPCFRETYVPPRLPTSAVPLPAPGRVKGVA